MEGKRAGIENSACYIAFGIRYVLYMRKYFAKLAREADACRDKRCSPEREFEFKCCKQQPADKRGAESEPDKVINRKHN